MTCNRDAFLPLSEQGRGSDRRRASTGCVVCKCVVHVRCPYIDTVNSSSTAKPITQSYRRDHSLACCRDLVSISLCNDFLFHRSADRRICGTFALPAEPCSAFRLFDRICGLPKLFATPLMNFAAPMRTEGVIRFEISVRYTDEHPLFDTLESVVGHDNQITRGVRRIHVCSGVQFRCARAKFEATLPSFEARARRTGDTHFAHSTQ